MWSPIEKCWVPNCANSRERGYTKNFFPLPTSARYKEIWLSLAGKKFSGLEDLIYFCQDHFDPNVVETYMDKFVCLNATATPYFNMPERICRTCMSIIMDGDVFSVLSAKVPCTIPADIKSELLTCRPEPLLQVLNFCIPDLNLSHDPLPLSCYKCYHNIWLFYIFKVTCNAVEKSVLSLMTPVEYGKLVVCRACPTTLGNSVFVLKEESPLGKLLKKMFLTNHAVEIVPLKVCLKCWNVLVKLEKFYQQCLTVEQKMQRHLALNQFSPNNLLTPSTSLALPQCKTQMNHLREYRKVEQRYMPTDTSAAQSYPTPESSMQVDGSVASTSVIKFSGKCETSFGQGSSGGVPNGDLIYRVRNNVLEKIERAGTSTSFGQSSNFPQTSTFVPDRNDNSKADISDDENDPENRDKDPSTKQRLTPTEKIALAQLMLKYGAPLKADVSPKIHFEAWVNIVREFHQQGYERPLEIIQKSWKSMKKKAEMAFGAIGPPTEVNRLVLDFLKDGQSNNNAPGVSHVETGMKKDCEVICIDDDMSNNKKNVVVKTDVEPVVHKSRRNKRQIVPSTPPKTAKKPGPNKRTKDDYTKSPRKKMKKESPKYRARDNWDQQRKLELVRNMKKEYESCLKNSEPTTAKSPWKMILERLCKKEYRNYPYDKLYSAWCRMKISATIHEKDGVDLVDEEVWEMLQIQNAVQKSIMIKETPRAHKTEKEEKPKTNDGASTSRAVEEGIAPPIVKEKKELKEKKQVTGTESERKPSRAVKKETPKPSEPSSDSEGARSSTPRSKRYCQWSEDDKMQLVKLIKAEFMAMLKAKEPLTSGPWRRCIDRVIQKGYDKPSYSVYPTWTQIRKTAWLHESGRQMSILDHKVLRLLNLYKKWKNVQKGLPTRNQSQSREPEVMKEKEEETAQETDTSERHSESDKDVIMKISREQKLDVISMVTKHGGEVFQLKKNRGTFWPKVHAQFTAKGHNWEMTRVRNCWQNLLTSAKHAWADQKEPNEFDRLIIDFMTEVIQEKKKNEEGETTNGEEKDDRFDEITERMSDNSNGAPGNAASDDDDKAGVMNYDYVSLEDIQKNYGVDTAEVASNEEATVKNEPPEESFNFKIESYQSEQVIEIMDSDED